MRQAATKRIFEYWNRIRAGRSAPSREEIEPSDIRHFLSDTFILDVSGRLRVVSYRLAGTRLCAAYGRELKGYGFLCNFAEENGFDVMRTLSRVYRDFKPQLISILAETVSGKTVEYEMLLLPLKPVSDGEMRILGIATPAETPYWLGADPLTLNRIVSMRTVEPIDLPEDSATLAPSLDGPHLAVAPVQPLQPRRIAHLVVHEGGKSEE